MTDRHKGWRANEFGSGFRLKVLSPTAQTRIFKKKCKFRLKGASASSHLRM